MYIVMELQTAQDGSVSMPPVNTFENWQEAEARYHSILSVAAVSSLPMHTAMIVTGDGMTVRSEHYEHEVE